tara:strand:- start:225 stop:563 length:339 start_codon:yes stop_codon:yes gene_type:complete
MQKVESIKEQIESGMYFKLAKHDKKVFKFENTKHGNMLLTSYHVLPKGGKLHSDTVIIRRLGENNMDYFTFDMFNKKTRGRIQFSDITEFEIDVPQPIKGEAPKGIAVSTGR